MFYPCRAIVRAVIIPFTTTPPDQQLSAVERDAADRDLLTAKKDAKRGLISCDFSWKPDNGVYLVAVAELIKIKGTLLCCENELSEVATKVCGIIPDVKIRVQRSYSWLMFATLKVHLYSLV